MAQPPNQSTGTAAQTASEEPVHKPGRPLRRWYLRRRYLAGAALLALGGGLWAARLPLAESLVDRELAKRGTEARYTIESLSPTRQVLTDIIIGNPAKPDLTARRVILSVGYSLSGPFVKSVRAEGVRLFGRYDGQAFQFGALDPYLASDPDAPFALPDLALALTDARLALQTPWGPVGLAAEGRGNVRRNWSGRMALSGKALTAGDCALDRLRHSAALRTIDGRIRLNGPVTLAAAACPDARLRVTDVALAVEAEVSSDAARIAADVNGTAAQWALGDARAGPLSLATQVQMRGDRLTADYDVTANALTAAGYRAASLRAQGELAGQGENIGGQAAVTLARGSAPPTMVGTFAYLATVADGTPLAAFVRQAATSFGAAAQRVDGSATLRFSAQRSNLADSAALNVTAFRLNGGNGLTLAVDDRPSARWQGGRNGGLSVDALARMTGGGLPDARLALRGGRGDNWRADLTLAPWTIGADRLALTPLALDYRPGHGGRVTTRVALSGPLGTDGRIERLDVPIAARWDGGGGVTIDGGCRNVGLARAISGNVTLDAGTYQLCSMPGQPLLAFRGGTLRGEARLPSLRLSGRLGDSPLLVSAAQSRFNFGNRDFSLRDLDLWLGDRDAPQELEDAAPTDSAALTEAEAAALALAASLLPNATERAATRVAADRVTGRGAGGVWTGNIDGLRGHLANVPLLVRRGEGDWRWAGDEAVLNAAAYVRDAEAAARFQPLLSRNITVRLNDGRVTADATFAEPQSDAPVVRAAIRHDLASGEGGADLFVDSLAFDREGLQPSDISRLAIGIIANAQGVVTGRGQIAWTPDGVTSTGGFTTSGADFAAAFGTVRGATTSIYFEDLLGLRSAPGQRIGLDEINPGLAVLGGVIRYQMLDAQRLRIEGGRWPFAGGLLELEPTILDFSQSAVRRLQFRLTGVDAAVFMQEMGFANITATGVFDGAFPVEFSGIGGRIAGGKLVSRPGGGSVSYIGELSQIDMGVMANFAFGMLKSLSYRSMVIDLNGALDGEMITDVKFEGLQQGPAARRNIITRQIARVPIVLNLKIVGPFRELFGTAQGLYDPTLMAVPDVRAVMNRNAAALSGPSGPPGNAPDPVQPVESENRP